MQPSFAYPASPRVIHRSTSRPLLPFAPTPLPSDAQTGALVRPSTPLNWTPSSRSLTPKSSPSKPSLKISLSTNSSGAQSRSDSSDDDYGLGQYCFPPSLPIHDGIKTIRPLNFRSKCKQMSIADLRRAIIDIGARPESVTSSISSGDKPEPYPYKEWSDDVFEPLQHLGEGVGGTVHEVRDTRTGRIMARKTITTREAPMKQLVRELTMITTISHPNITHFFGAYMSPSSSEVKVVMELCEGRSLEAVGERIKRRKGRVGEKVAGRLAEGVLQGLAYLHAKHLIHRDIKPSNILISKQGIVKLCDFGVSGELVKSQADTYTGTACYMAPERIQGHEYSIRADVWSAGLSILELVQNRFPFPKDLPPIDLMIHISRSEPPRLEDEFSTHWSDAMKDFVKVSLTVNPTVRPSPKVMLTHPWIVRVMKYKVDMAQWISEVWGWNATKPLQISKENSGRNVNTRSSLPAWFRPRAIHIALEFAVIVVGAGIAGPILAIFLKLRGYEPVIFERLDGVEQAGLSMILQPNGLRVLSQIPGFVSTIPGKSIERMLQYSTLPEDLGVLGESDIPNRLPSCYGFGMLAVERVAFHRVIVDAAISHGIEVNWGHQLTSLEQSDDSVRAIFENGKSATGTFVVGCDGLHSGTRIALFGKEKADFTGLCQAGGLSPTPDVLKAHATVANYYGNAAHMIAYPISDTHTSWAVTTREKELKETWGTVSAETAEDFINNSAASHWDNGPRQMLKTTNKLVKYGLYDRPELKTWHKGRVVLLGDAAHPTSPHLGQGANQAFEDIQKLTSLLDEYNPNRTSLSTSVLATIFEAYEKSAHPPLCNPSERNAIYRDIMKDDESVAKVYAVTYGDVAKEKL
ncbi:hypothetical protein EW146_g4877 [Bondarzewia mesenterica]|uniref:mitogen-activated protein kinase kinase n=1 Tax=Bondarzewia mesenterica TaxID=1095465 RepID=A0A4S4LU72_9AGAM|nr:hypothetical protein EW146_g4877 [Bondarzewia mesenterica]